MWVLRIKLGTSCLPGRHFTDWAISLDCRIRTLNSSTYPLHRTRLPFDNAWDFDVLLLSYFLFIYFLVSCCTANFSTIFEVRQSEEWLYWEHLQLQLAMDMTAGNQFAMVPLCSNSTSHITSPACGKSQNEHPQLSCFGIPLKPKAAALEPWGWDQLPDPGFWAGAPVREDIRNSY